jgi:hypothetical protein
MDEIYEIFKDVNCSKSELRRVLDGKRFSKWNALKEMALSTDPKLRLFSTSQRPRIKKKSWLGQHS